jgi:hypothetical protein
MKKLYYIFIYFGLLFSCSLDDTPIDATRLEILPIHNISFPEYFEYNQIYNIEYSYVKPTVCHSFHSLFYEEDNDERTIAVMSITYESNYCESSEELETRSFNFHCTNEEGVYIFKLWQGKNDEGEDIYISYTVPINQN